MLRRLAVVLVYSALAAATAVIVRRQPQLSLAGTSTVILVAELAVGYALLAIAIAGHGRFDTLLATVALAWPLREWNTPAAGLAFTAGLVLYAAWPPVLAAAAMRGRDDRTLGRAGTGVVLAGVVASVGVLGLLSAATFDPPAQGCRQCPVNRLLIGGNAGALRHLGQVGLALTVAWTAAFVVIAVGRLARATPSRRRLSAPVLVPAALAVSLFGAEALHGLRRGYLSSDPTDRRLHLAQLVALALVAAGAAWGRWRTRRTRSALGRLVVDFGAAPSPGGVRERLASRFDDPSLELRFARNDDTWIDADGRPTTLVTGGGSEVTRVAIGGEVVCAVIHRQGLFDDPALATQLAAVARLALHHEWLQAVRRAHLEEMRASRARIVAAADGERRRLERDLHDGAQQRLVALAVGIRLARRRTAAERPSLAAALADCEEQLGLAVDELRAVANGLFPAVLGDEGLASALEVLAETDIRLVPGKLTEQRCGAEVESAAYYLVAQALRLAGDGDIDVAVDVHHQDGWLHIDVRTASTFAEAVPARVDDRIGAVGGTLTIGAHQLHAELPCAS